MKKLVAIAAAAAALAGGVSTAHAETRSERGEANLARILDGYEATGETKRCISAFRTNKLRVIPYVGVVYDAGDTIYVARATRPESLRDSDVPVFERYSSQLCSNDVMRTVDRYSPNFAGVLFLEDFEQFSRVDQG